jgi:U3 small nucleolar ribonucleoprotein component
MTKANNEFRNFDIAMRKVLTVSHEELQKREKEWKRKRANKKRAKASPASRASNG